MSVVLETSIGDITVDLYVDERPKCCLNFLKLCKVKYYNFHLFHSVQPNFIAQTGDPTGTGRGGESIFCKLYGNQAQYFDAELKPRIKHSKMGCISMVNDGNNRHGSQFFITLVENNDYLDKQNHTVFGEVSEGFDILEKLNNSIMDENNRPLKDIRIFHTVVLDDPFPDPSGLDEYIPDRSPVANTQEQLEPRIAADEDTDDEKDLDPEEVEEKNRDRQARTNAQILELIGDIPDVDVKPPDNVLFVCKLNPVTTDEDLEIIFSRHGPIKACEIIRNKKTNESLQYAFIEFENHEDCEKAYFKMDNVLIDERRIHVDFSQSVSKIKWERPGKDNDEQKPQYKIKDFEKKNDGYEFVFEEPQSERQPDKKKKSYKHEKKEKDSTSREGKKVRYSPSPEAEECLSNSTARRVHKQPGDNKRRHSPARESRRQRRSPSEDEERSRRHAPTSKDSKRRRLPSKSSEEENDPRSGRDERRRGRRRHTSSSGEERMQSFSGSRRHDDHRRDRSTEREHKRRRSSSREGSGHRGRNERNKDQRPRRPQ